MNLLTIPFRNTRRKSTRTLLLLVIFTLGVISIVALYQVSQVVGHSLEKKLTAYGANILVSPGSETLGVSYGGFHLGDMLFDIQPLYETKTIEAIRSIELKDRISVVAPKLVSMTKLGQVAVAVVGVRWKDELLLKSYWATDGTFPAGEDDVLVGSKASQTLGISTGDRITLMGEQFNVSGILYETGGDDDGVILMGIQSLQRITDRQDEVSFIEVAALCSGCPIDDIVGQIRGQLPGVEIKALRNVVSQRMASINFVQRLVLSISIVILITAAAMVGLSMLSAVNERKKDIGLLRSMGYGKKQVFLIFCLEAAFLGIVAGFVGYIGGFATSYKALDLLTFSDGLNPVFHVDHLLLSCGLGTLVAVLAALYPAWKGSAIEPSQALIAF